MSEAFVAELRRQGGALAELAATAPTPSSQPGPPQLAAMGPRAAGREQDYELLLGDQLYALGLSRLAELGDLDAVAELADLISLVAQAQAADDEDLSEAVWEAGAVAIGWGCTPGLTAAKAAARAHEPGAAAQLRAAAAAARDGAR